MLTILAASGLLPKACLETPPALPTAATSEDAEGEPDPAMDWLRREAGCATEPAPVVVTPSPPIETLEDLCDAIRDQPSVGDHRTGCEWAAGAAHQVQALKVDPPQLEHSWIGGLGTSLGPWRSTAEPPAPEELAALGVAPESFERWLAVARKATVSRVERWKVVIPDPYHGKPGLVVREDVAFRVGESWQVCVGKDSELLDDNDPVTPDNDACARRGTTRWWTCTRSGP